MAPNPSNSNNLEQVALKGLTETVVVSPPFRRYAHVKAENPNFLPRSHLTLSFECSITNTWIHPYLTENYRIHDLFVGEDHMILASFV